MVRFIINILALVSCVCMPAAAGTAEPPQLGIGHELKAAQSGDGRLSDLYGTAYDIDGNTLVVGAWTDAVGHLYDVGSVYVYTRVSGRWQLQQKLTHPSPVQGRRFGYDVAISGDSLIVGSPGNGSANSSGAFLYTRAGSNWSLALSMVGNGYAFGTKVDIAGSLAYAANGFSNCVSICLGTVVSQRVSGVWMPAQPIPAPDAAVPYLSASAAISADGTLVIGADADAQNGDRIIAQVLRVQSGTIVPVQRLTVPSSFAQEIGSELIVALAAESGTLAIGAPNTSYVDRPSTGAVFLWRRVSGAWTMMNAAVDSVPSGRTSHGFGRYIAMDGDRLAATFFEGDVGEPPTVDLAAGVRAFSRSNNVWLATDRTVRNDPRTNPYGPLALSGQHLFTYGSERSAVDLDRAYVVIREHGASHAGASVVASAFNPPGMRGFRYGDGLASSGPLLLVGAPSPASGYDSGRGAVYVFRRGTGAPIPVATLVAPGGHPGDAFGAAIAADDELVMIGAPSQVVGVEPGRGAVHVYARQGDSLAYRGMLSHPQLMSTSNFGSRIALQGGRALVASHGNSGVGTGRVDYFVRDGAGEFQLVTFLVNPAPNESGTFGASLAIDGSRVAIGHMRLEHPADTPPRVEIFTATATMLQPETTITSTNAGFGTSIALSGDYLLVGASGLTVAAGRVIPYFRTGGVWNAQPEITNPDGASELSRFGAVLVRGGDFVYVGAPALGVTPGYAYRYHAPIAAASISFVQRLSGLRPHNSDAFGTSIAATADGSVFVSSPHAGGAGDFDNPDDGAVYEFGDYLLVDGFE